MTIITIMAEKKKNTTTSIKSIRHKDKRKNIPTEPVCWKVIAKLSG